MTTPTRLGLFALGVAAVFGVALLVGRYLVPDQSDRAAAPADHSAHSGGHAGMGGDDHAGHGGTAAVAGTSRSADGYALTAVGSPTAVGAPGELRFTVTAPDGKPLTRFTPAHEKELHLIVVRTDGAHFFHLHPTRAADGTWSIPWQAPAAGTYRVITDFVPGDRDGDTPVVLGTDVEIGGTFTPVAPEPRRTDTVDGFTATLDGDLKPGAAQNLTITVRHGEHPVTLQPYLGARGHLVALRTGDLAYTHVHPVDGDTHGDGGGHGDHVAHEEHAGGGAGTVAFSAQPPSSGRYLLYFDFQIDGVVRTATFVVDTE